MDDVGMLVLLVSNHRLFRECLANGLTSRISGLTIETAGSCEEGMRKFSDSDFSIAIFDADQPDPFLPEMSRMMQQNEEKETTILVVGRTRAEGDVIAYLEAGASDYRISDSESLNDFCDAVERMLKGEMTYGPERTRALFARLQKLSNEVAKMKSIDGMILTEREMEILNLVDEGQSNQQIAKELHISLHTVKNHVHRILEKLQVRNRREAVHLAYTNGWIKVNAG